MAKKKFQLSFSPDLVNVPITYRMVKDFDLQINILRAEINETAVRMLIEIEGKAADQEGGRVPQGSGVRSAS